MGYKCPSEEAWPLELSVQEVGLPSPVSVARMCHRDVPLGNFLLCRGRRVFSPLLPLPPPLSFAGKGGLSYPCVAPWLPGLGMVPWWRLRPGHLLLLCSSGLGASARTLPSKTGLQLMCLRTPHEPAGPHASRALGNHDRSVGCKAWGTWGDSWLSHEQGRIFFFSLKIKQDPGQ